MGRSVIEWLTFTNEEDGSASVSELRTFGTLQVHTASLAVFVASLCRVFFYVFGELDHNCRRGAAATVVSRANLADCGASPSFAGSQPCRPSCQLPASLPPDVQRGLPLGRPRRSVQSSVRRRYSSSAPAESSASSPSPPSTSPFSSGTTRATAVTTSPSSRETSRTPCAFLPVTRT